MVCMCYIRNGIILKSPVSEGVGVVVIQKLRGQDEVGGQTNVHYFQLKVGTRVKALCPGSVH